MINNWLHIFGAPFLPFAIRLNLRSCSPKEGLLCFLFSFWFRQMVSTPEEADCKVFYSNQLLKIRSQTRFLLLLRRSSPSSERRPLDRSRTVPSLLLRRRWPPPLLKEWDLAALKFGLLFPSNLLRRWRSIFTWNKRKRKTQIAVGFN